MQRLRRSTSGDSGRFHSRYGGNMAFRILIGFIVVSVTLVAVLSGLSSPSAAANRRSISAPAPTPAAAADKALYSEYRGVTLGMSIDEARAKLGKAKDSSDQQDYYMISDGETVQIVYESKVVRGISATFVGAGAKAPTPMAVFGIDAEAKPDGSINKMVRYPKAGYWVSYIRTGGDDPMVMITIHKLQKGEI